MSPYTKKINHFYPLTFSWQRKKIFSLIFLKKPLILNIIFISLILFFVIFQFILVNRMAIYGFKIKELSEKKRLLEQDKKNLELEIIKRESGQGTENYFKNLNLVEIEKLEYLKPVGGIIAEK